MMKTGRFIVVTTIAVFIFLLFLGIRHYYTPQLYKRGLSPDKSWEVSVFRHRKKGYPMADGVVLFAVITDYSGRILRKINLDTMDRWGDVEANFPDLGVRNDEAIFGSCFGDPSTSSESHWKEGYSKITKN